MCSKATCPSCKRPTYRGCGQHVEQVLGDVPVAERCACRSTGRKAPATVGAGAKRSWFSRRR